MLPAGGQARSDRQECGLGRGQRLPTRIGPEGPEPLAEECDRSKNNNTVSRYLPYGKGQIVCPVPGAVVVDAPPEPAPSAENAARAARAEQWEPPKKNSIVEVTNESRACNSFAKNAPGLPKFSDGCIILAKGERVVITSWSNDPHALRKGYALYWPYYCVRPASMDTDRCYYTDLTALEVDGVRGATVGMYEEPPEKPITRDDCRTHADTFMLTRKMSMREASRYSKCVAMYGEPPQFRGLRRYQENCLRATTKRWKRSLETSSGRGRFTSCRTTIAMTTHRSVGAAHSSLPAHIGKPFSRSNGKTNRREDGGSRLDTTLLPAGGPI